MSESTMSFEGLGDVIAMRELALRNGGSITVSIGKPREFPEGGSWYCPYRIDGLQQTIGRYIGGADAVQALELALRTIGVDLAHSAEGRRDEIVGLDEDAGNHGVPPRNVPRPASARWRPMTRADLPAVARIAAIVHPAYPEDPAIAGERLALEPAGCFVLDGAEGPAAYLLSHRWTEGAPPPLDTLLHALPPHPTIWYVHDIALSPEMRGQGAARAIVAELDALARSHGLHRIALVAVNRSVPFWTRHGFADATTPALMESLASYGPDARYMARDLV